MRLIWTRVIRMCHCPILVAVIAPVQPLTRASLTLQVKVRQESSMALDGPGSLVPPPEPVSRHGLFLQTSNFLPTLAKERFQRLFTDFPDFINRCSSEHRARVGAGQVGSLHPASHGVGHTCCPCVSLAQSLSVESVVLPGVEGTV